MHIQQLIKPKLFFSETICTFVLKGAVSFLDIGSLFFTSLSCFRWVLFLVLIHFGNVSSSFKMKNKMPSFVHTYDLLGETHCKIVVHYN
jgi:hypothetical protein